MALIQSFKLCLNLSRTLVLIGLISISNNLRSQNFLETGNQWIFEFYNVVGPTATYNHKIDSITITKDTIINNKNYFQLESTRSHYCGIFSSLEYLREEEDKIYRLSKDFQSEYLMLDFKEVDSYLMQTDSGFGFIESEVIIDSIGISIFPSGQEIETQFMRVLNNQSYGDEALYKVHQKVGFLNPGFLFPNIGTGLCDHFDKAIQYKCFISNQDTINFTERGCFDFNIIDSTNELFEEQIELFPNPTFDQINLPEGYMPLKVYDIKGIELQVPINQNTLDLSQLKNGAYVLILKNTSSNKRFVTKVVKM